MEPTNHSKLTPSSTPSTPEPTTQLLQNSSRLRSIINFLNSLFLCLFGCRNQQQIENPTIKAPLLRQEEPPRITASHRIASPDPTANSKPIHDISLRAETLDDESLIRQANHYQQKYEIPIEVIESEEALVKRLNELLDRSESEPIRLAIIARPSKNDSHVTPIIVNFSKEQKEILDLDIRSNTAISLALEPYKERVSIFESRGRQSDSRSCRTEALTIVRNVLLYMKDQTSSTGHPVNVSDILKRSSSGKSWHLPTACSYTSQLTRGLHTDDDQSSVIRERFSKKAEKKANPRTVSAFRERLSAVTGSGIRINLYLHLKGFAIL